MTAFDVLLLCVASVTPEFWPAVIFAIAARHSQTFWRVTCYGVSLADVTQWPAIEATLPALHSLASNQPAPQLPIPSPQPAPIFAPPAQSRQPLTPTTPLRTSRNRTSVELLAICDNATHLGIVGASGAGKSTFLQAFVSHLATQGVQVVVIDPHAGPNKWRGASQVEGNSASGPNFSAIAGVLDSAILETNTRLGMIYQGAEENSFPPMAIVCDEWRDIALNVPEAGDKLARLLSTARKVSIKVIVGTQSKNVKALFGDGRGDGSIRDCLTLLNLTRDKSNERYGMIDSERYEVPTPVPAGTPPEAPVFQSSHSEESFPFPLEPDESPLADIAPEQREMILTLSRQGWNRDKIATTALKGTRRSDALKTIRLVLEHTA